MAFTESDAMSQAEATAYTYLYAAVEKIDHLLGKGYAAKNPQLVAAFMQTASADFSDWQKAEIARLNRSELSDLITCFCEQMQEMISLVDRINS